MIRFALLGLLREQSDYGYGLKRRFDRRAGACWELNGGQVYQTLHALERAGFVAEVQEMAPSDSRRDRFPPRRMMTVTAKGARFHERWLRRAPVAPPPVRDELLVRLIAHTEDELSALLDHITAQQRMLSIRLTTLLAQRDRAAVDNTADGLVRQLSLEAAVRHAEAHLGWLDYCRERIAAHVGKAAIVVGD